MRLAEALAHVRGLSGEEAAGLLMRFSGPRVYEVLERHYGRWLRELAALVLWLGREPGYGEPELGVALGEDGRPLFVVITLPGCSEEEWDSAARRAKDSMARAGLGELRRLVAIVCAGRPASPRGLRGLLKPGLNNPGVAPEA